MTSATKIGIQLTGTHFKQVNGNSKTDFEYQRITHQQWYVKQYTKLFQIEKLFADNEHLDLSTDQSVNAYNQIDRDLQILFQGLYLIDHHFDFIEYVNVSPRNLEMALVYLNKRSKSPRSWAELMNQIEKLLSIPAENGAYKCIDVKTEEENFQIIAHVIH